MLGLTNTATLYSKLGQSGGKPSYSDEGTEFACRIQPGRSRSASGKQVQGASDVLIFALNMDISEDDKIVTSDGLSLRVKNVETVYGYSGVHHLEIDADREG